MLFRCFSVFSALIILEFCSFLLLTFQYGNPKQIQLRRNAIAESDPIGENPSWTLPVVPHPYFGVILPPTNPVDGPLAINAYGFFGTDSPVQSRSDTEFRIAVVGGSVARQLVQDSEQIFVESLARLPCLANKEIKVVSLAADGYKQPQQLLAITYLTILGGEFDAVVNLDGLNEIALPAIDNIPMGVFASFPRSWGVISAAAGSGELRRIQGYATHLRLQNCEGQNFLGDCQCGGHRP